MRGRSTPGTIIEVCGRTAHDVMASYYRLARREERTMIGRFGGQCHAPCRQATTAGSLGTSLALQF